MNATDVSPRRIALRRCTILLAVAAMACGDDTAYRSPTAPAPPAPNVTFEGMYQGSAVLQIDTLSAVCGGTPTGRIEGLVWSVRTLDDAQLELTLWYDDYETYEHGGTLTGRDFVAGWASVERAFTTCALRESLVSGRFSEDFASLEVYQTVVYGPQERPLRMEWLWHARRF